MPHKFSTRLSTSVRLMTAGCVLFLGAVALAEEKYENVEKRFSLTIPEGWKRTDPKETKAVMSIYVPNEKFKENVNVVVFEFAQSSQEEIKSFFTADSFPTRVIERYKKQWPDAKLKQTERTKVAGKFAWKMGYETPIDNLRVRGTQWAVLNENRIYTITWTDAEGISHPAQVDEIIKSFKFLEKK